MSSADARPVDVGCDQCTRGLIDPDSDRPRPCPACRPWLAPCPTCGHTLSRCRALPGARCCPNCPHRPPVTTRGRRSDDAQP